MKRQHWRVAAANHCGGMRLDQNVASSVASEAAKHQRHASGDPVLQGYEHRFYVFAVESVDEVQEQKTREARARHPDECQETQTTLSEWVPGCM